ncbi:hypothetical protein [Tsuneonella mangrovi]|uniref:hypothetical protein n=1 Tax=Tsuneonella mangrovi TaxID=1982042 RepID=UPI000BA1CD7E|nr:hypothetical protein [Tsuneonella mangrovi]
MDEPTHAKGVIGLLSPAEKAALKSLIAGESLVELARRRAITTEGAYDLSSSMKLKLGVTQNAAAVRIGLMAGLT